MKEEIKSEYDLQAEKFLEKTGTEFKAVFVKNDKYFPDDKETRDIYQITLKRGSREYKFNFGQSLNSSGEFIAYTPSEGKKAATEKEAMRLKTKGMQAVRNKDYAIPSAYSVLASLTKYDIGSFKDFCSEFGYDEDSRTAEKTYKAVLNEYNNLKILFSDEELQEMQEIN